MVRVAVFVVPLAAAEITAVVTAGRVDTLKVAVLVPPATTTVAGTVALTLLLLKLTVTPTAGALVLRVSVATDGLPPRMLAGLRVSVEGMGALTVSEAVFVMLPETALIVTLVSVVTALVATENVAVELPAATLTLAGTVAAPLLLESATTTGLPTALLVRVTVPVEVVDPP